MVLYTGVYSSCGRVVSALHSVSFADSEFRF